MDKPLVSIILPVHNSAGFLHDCLQSLIKQTYRNIEIIAIDNDSKDHSFKILNQFKKQDKRIRIYKNIKKYGISVSLNRAIKRAKGQFITFMNSKDLCLSHRIKKQVDFLMSNPKITASGAQCFYIDENNKKVDKSDFPVDHESISQILLRGLSLQFETVMINKHILPKDILKFKPNSHPLFFIDILMKILPYGEFANIPDYLYYHRRKLENQNKNIKFNVSIFKFWFKSIFTHEARLPIRSLFYL